MRTLTGLILLLAGFPQESALNEALRKANPEYKGDGRFRTDGSGNVVGVVLIGPVSDLSPLKDLSLTSLRVTSPTLIDLSPLKGMKLTSVDLQACPLLTDLSSLEGMPLESATFYACRALKEIAPLRRANLRRLNIEGSAVGDLSPLKEQSALAWARLCTNRIADVAPLADLPLTCLDLTYAKDIVDLAPLRGLNAMDDLRLDFIRASDLSPVRNMKKLRILSILDCPNLKDLSIIAELPQLKAFIFTPKHFSPEQIEIVRRHPSIKYLDVGWKSWNNQYCGNPDTPNPCQTAEAFWNRYDAGEYSK